MKHLLQSKFTTLYIYPSVVSHIMVLGVAGAIVWWQPHVTAVSAWLTIRANTTFRRLAIVAPILGIEAIAVM